MIKTLTIDLTNMMFIALITFVMLISAALPQKAAAQTSGSSNVELQQLINDLLAQIALLQARLEEMNDSSETLFIIESPRNPDPSTILFNEDAPTNPLTTFVFELDVGLGEDSVTVHNIVLLFDIKNRDDIETADLVKGVHLLINGQYYEGTITVFGNLVFSLDGAVQVDPNQHTEVELQIEFKPLANKYDGTQFTTYVDGSHIAATIENIEVNYDGSAFSAVHKLSTEAESSDSIVNGDSDDNLLVGTDARDVMYGKGGNDTIAGNGGSDFLNGDDGNDSIWGHDGHDLLYGGTGDDRLFGGEGTDQLIGNEGDDELIGDAGNDVLTGNSGQDNLYGKDGDDVLKGGPDKDVLYGDAGDDTFVIKPRGGYDWIIGFEAGAGSDDVIEITGYGLDTFGQIMDATIDVGSDTRIQLDGNFHAINLKGVQKSELHPDDFIGVGSVLGVSVTNVEAQIANVLSVTESILLTLQLRL